MIHECILEVQRSAALFGDGVTYVLPTPKHSIFSSPQQNAGIKQNWAVWESPSGCVWLGTEQLSVLTGEERNVFGINLFILQAPPPQTCEFLLFDCSYAYELGHVILTCMKLRERGRVWRQSPILLNGIIFHIILYPYLERPILLETKRRRKKKLLKKVISLYFLPEMNGPAGVGKWRFAPTT